MPLGYAQSGGCSERKKDRTQNNVTPTPGEACAEERQGGEQCWYSGEKPVFAKTR
jgi:hypothetical protein